MKISIQLLTYNAEKYVVSCLNSVLAQNFRDFELVIIDNASNDNTRELIKKWIKEHKSISTIFISNEKNIGFTGGHNLALRRSKGEYVLFLNQDIILEPDFLQIAIQFLEKHPEVGSISPKLFRLTSKGKTSIIDSLGITFQNNLQAIDFFSGKDEKEMKFSEPFEIFAPSGACPMHRRSALESVFFLDEDFFMYKDDVDLGFRLALQGWKSYCVPNARAYHERSAKEVVAGHFFWQVARNRTKKNVFINALSYQNHWYVILKNMPYQILLRHFFSFFWYEKKQLIYLFLFEWSTLKKIPSIFRKFPLMFKKRKEILRKKKISWQELERRMFLSVR